MTETLLLIGSTGAIGRPLTRLLAAGGDRVFGTTRSPEKSGLIEADGAIPLTVDVLDEAAVRKAVLDVRPSVIVSQITDLPFGLPAEHMEVARTKNAFLREHGTRNLVRAAIEAGCPRLVSQSIAWVYAGADFPALEDTPIDPEQSAILAMESMILTTPGIAGTVLRYGLFYGQGTGFDTPAGKISVHVVAAAKATHLAIAQKACGVFNITDDCPLVSNARARQILGWQPDQ